jgi:protein-tyrosine phosphatase
LWIVDNNYFSVPTTLPIMRITVVCLGNICRSPIGEVVLTQRIATADLAHRVLVDSAGTGDWHLGHPADPRSVAVLEQAGYEISHTARQITADWLAGIDLALAMDCANYENLQRMITEVGASTSLRMMRSFDPSMAHIAEPSDVLDVPDPYYGGEQGFIDVLAMIERASDGLVAQLRNGTLPIES